MGNRSDDFNRANANLNGATPSDGGSAWSDTAGNNWAVSSNQARVSAALFTRDTALLEASSSVGEVQATFSTLGNATALVLRAADASNHICSYVSSNSLANYKRVAGSYTQIGSTYTGSVVSGDVIKLGVTSANAISAYVNGTLRVGPNTDSTGSTNTKAGLESLSNLTTVRVDDWSFTDLAGGAATSSPPRRAFPRAILNF